MKRQPKQIFISYRRDGGGSFARLLYERLSADGYNVFYDVESLQSGKFNIALYERIMECTDFLLVLSPHCLDRCSSPKDWLRLEIEFAKNCDKNIIPMIMRGFVFPDNLPNSIDDLPRYNGVEVNIEYFDAVVHKLEKTLLHSKPDLSQNTNGNHQSRENNIDIKPDDTIVAPHNRYSDKTIEEMMVLARRDAHKYESSYRTALQAARGDAESQYNLGKLYYKGISIKGSKHKAVYWLYLAAKAGNTSAMHLLGNCYYHGKGVTHSYAQAVYWYRESRNHSNPSYDAECSLGDCYKKGKGVRSDIIQAAEHYHTAMNGGNATGIVRYIDLINKTSKKNKEKLRSYEYTIEKVGTSQMEKYQQIKQTQKEDACAITALVGILLGITTVGYGLLYFTNRIETEYGLLFLILHGIIASGAFTLGVWRMPSSTSLDGPLENISFIFVLFLLSIITMATVLLILLFIGYVSGIFIELLS